MRPITASAAAPRTATLRTRPSRLSISIYPPFAYDATGGVGAGRVVGTAPADAPAGALGLAFDDVTIPPLDWRTARFLGLPLPPFLRIDIVPKRLEGWVHPPTGAVALDFDADFFFTAFGTLYAPPAIGVATTLTTGVAAGGQLRGAGSARDAATAAVRLAGVSTVKPTGDGFLDAFLRAPSECLAVLDAELVLD